jgi:hypothetical protein
MEFNRRMREKAGAFVDMRKCRVKRKRHCISSTAKTTGPFADAPTAFNPDGLNIHIFRLSIDYCWPIRGEGFTYVKPCLNLSTIKPWQGHRIAVPPATAGQLLWPSKRRRLLRAPVRRCADKHLQQSPFTQFFMMTRFNFVFFIVN